MRLGTLTAGTAIAALVLAALAAPAEAQSARAVGVVRDVNGKALKGATVRAVNPDAIPSEFTSATDSKGRWAMLGLRTGNWRFIAESPGFLPQETTLPVRVANTSPIAFSLERDPGPIPNALAGNVQQAIKDAAAHRDQGRLDQAIQAYVGIKARNPTLTSVNFVLADVYRQKAAQEPDPDKRQGILRLAADAYAELLAADAGNERAQAAMASLRADLPNE